jgi:hypothetical protein
MVVQDYVVQIHFCFGGSRSYHWSNVWLKKNGYIVGEFWKIYGKNLPIDGVIALNAQQ